MRITIQTYNGERQAVAVPRCFGIECDRKDGMCQGCRVIDYCDATKQFVRVNAKKMGALGRAKPKRPVPVGRRIRL